VLLGKTGEGQDVAGGIGEVSCSVGDPAALAGLLGQRVRPHVGVGAAIEGPVPELSDHLVERHRNFYDRYFKAAVRRAGLPEATRFHDLRHTNAALLIALGAHPEAIQERLGHSSIMVTLDRYGHLFPSLDEALTTRFEEHRQRALRTRPGPAATPGAPR
jgi:integrase